MIFISFHGGKPVAKTASGKTAKAVQGSSTPLNNIQAYDEKRGTLIEANVLRGADEYLVHGELRGMVLRNGYLYVVNGRKDATQILRFKGSGTEYGFKNIFATGRSPGSRAGIEGMAHPFALAFQGRKHCFVSNQDTGIVLRLKLDSPKGKTADPMPIPIGLPSKGKFFEGTFIASNCSKLQELKRTTMIAFPQGLDAFFDPELRKIHYSVRDVMVLGKHLYVCDQQAGMVKIYDLHGRLKAFSNSVLRPTHLLAHDGFLFLSGDNQLFAAELGRRQPYFEQIPDVDGSDASGMVFDESGKHFFVAARKKNKVHVYDYAGKGKFRNQRSLIENLPDNPEFLLHVPN